MHCQAVQVSHLHPNPVVCLQSGDHMLLPCLGGAGFHRGDRPQCPGPARGTYLMASHMSSPIFTQLRAWVGRDTGKPDTQ